METLTAHDAERRFPIEPVHAPRRALGSIVVAAIYVLMVLSTPFLLRYGPEPDVAAAASRITVQEDVNARCASAPEFGRPCPPPAPVTTVRGRFALFVP